MRSRMVHVAVFLLLACLGAASAQTPARQLLNSGYNYVPQGCPITVSISAEESQPSWFENAPEIRGQVTLSNPTQYNVPISSVIVQASSSNGQLYSTQAWCDNGHSTVVPYNPQAYTYGTATCRYRLVLDRKVFGTYGEHGSRRLLSNGGVQASFFPSSSSSSGGGSSGSGGYGYFPPPSQRPSWTVTAIATVSYSNTQCLSAPTPVNTDCWWDWLASRYNKHHHSWWSSLFSGRRLLSNTKPAAPQTPSKADTVNNSPKSSQQRKLLGAKSVVGHYAVIDNHSSRDHVIYFSDSGSAQTERDTNTYVSGRKLRGAEFVDTHYGRAEAVGSANGAGVYSVTGPNGGSVEGALTGSAQYAGHSNTYYRRPYVYGRKLTGAESTDTLYRNTERTGSYIGAGVYSVTGPKGGSVEGAHTGSAQAERNTNTYYKRP